MTEDRLKWVLSGLDLKRLNLLEKKFIRRIEEKLPEDITPSEEHRLELIYKSKSR